MAEVDVIIPARNPGPFLRTALQSVMAQTLSDWEAVVVDDGSSEDLGWVLEVDPRIGLIAQRNSGPSAARNAAIAVTSAPLVAFLDADDIWEPTKLRTQLDELRAHPEANLIDTAFERIDDAGGRVGGGYQGHHRTYLDLLGGCGICLSTVIVRRSALETVGGFDPRLRTVQDWDLWLRIAALGTANLRVEEVLCLYRVHEGGLSRNYSRTLIAGSRLLRKHLRSGQRRQDHRAVTAARLGLAELRYRTGTQAYDRARAALRRRNVVAAVGHLGVASALAPRYTFDNARRKVAR